MHTTSAANGTITLIFFHSNDSCHYLLFWDILLGVSLLGSKELTNVSTHFEILPTKTYANKTQGSVTNNDTASNMNFGAKIAQTIR